MEILGAVLGGLFRVLGHFFMEVIVEFILRRVGYAIWRRVSPQTDPEGLPSVLVGLLFWIVAISVLAVAYIKVSEGIAVDRCLDAGGAYDAVAKRCVHA